MLSRDQIELNSVFKKIQHCADMNEAVIVNFLKKTFDDLNLRMEENLSEVITREIFSSYLDLPLIVAYKIFDSFKSKKDEYSNSNSKLLSKKDFVRGMFNLYFGTSENLIQSTFKIFDIENKGAILLDDVLLLHNFLNTSEIKIKELEKFIYDFFGTKSLLTSDEYCSKIMNSDSNIFIIFLILLYYKQPFTEDCLKFYKISCLISSIKDSEDTSSCRGFINKPAKELNIYLKHVGKPTKGAKRKNATKDIFLYKKRKDSKDKVTDPAYMKEIKSSCSCFATGSVLSKLSEEICLVYHGIDGLEGLDVIERHEGHEGHEGSDMKTDGELDDSQQGIIYRQTGKENSVKDNYLKIENFVIKEEKVDNTHNLKKNNTAGGYKNNQFNNTLNNTLNGTLNNTLNNTPNNTLNGTLNNTLNNTQFNNAQFNNYHNNILYNNSLIESPDTTTNPYYEKIKTHSDHELLNDEIFITHVYKMTTDHKLKKFKLVLIDKSLFSFKYFSIKDEFIFERLLPLSGYFVTACETIRLQGSQLFPFALLPKFGTTMANLDNIFFFKSREELDTSIKTLAKALEVKDINDFYELFDDLGKGQFGTVKLGKNKITGEKVAIKIIKKNKLKETEVKLVRSELDVMKYLKFQNHPNVVKCIDVYEDKNCIYMVMECLTGGSLNNYLKQKGRLLKASEAKLVASQIAKALEFLHKKGIIHRDVKTDNIMLASKDLSDIKIVDFGLARVLAKSEMADESFGTLVYSSPEILMKSPYTDKVDVWSFGVLLYYILTGCYPFDGENISMSAIAIKICNEDFCFPKEISIDKQIKILIKDCLMKKSSKRPDISQIIKGHLL